MPFCSAVSQKPCLFSEDRSAYPQRLCYPCRPDLRPQHFLCLCFQELEKLGLGDSVDLHVYEIPVEYQTVQRLIPALWEKHSPQVSGAKVSGVKVGASLSGSAAGCPRQDGLCGFVPPLITCLMATALSPQVPHFSGLPLEVREESKHLKLHRGRFCPTKVLLSVITCSVISDSQNTPQPSLSINIVCFRYSLIQVLTQCHQPPLLTTHLCFALCFCFGNDKWLLTDILPTQSLSKKRTPVLQIIPQSL